MSVEPQIRLTRYSSNNRFKAKALQEKVYIEILQKLKCKIVGFIDVIMRIEFNPNKLSTR